MNHARNSRSFTQWVAQLAALLTAFFAVAATSAQSPTTQPTTRTVGPLDGGTVVPTAQLIRPAGDSVEFSGRPVDIAASPDGSVIYAKDNRGIVVVHTQTWRVLSEVAFTGGGGSMVGIAVSPDGARVYATQSSDGLLEYAVNADRTLTLKRRIALPGPDGKGASFPCGVTLGRDGATAYVCLSRNNALAVVELASGKVIQVIDTNIAPFKVALSPDEKTAFVTCWGGRKPRPDEKTAPSAGSPVAIDARGIATTGGVVAIDVAAGKLVREAETGLSACDVVLSRDGTRLYVANANSDTVTQLDAGDFKIRQQIVVKPDVGLPFGSMPNGLALDADGQRLFVSCAGNNAVAVINLGDAVATIEGWIPTGWYPGALIRRDDSLFVANIKGIGSRTARENDGAFNSHRHRGTLQRVAWRADAGGADARAAWTRQVREDSRVPQILKSIERSTAAGDLKPKPVPDRAGEPSTIEHVVYVIKENRTYDQVFGAIGKGRGEPKLCIFGREVTPNHHALAEQFVLLDNFYCNGVLSADGHSWSTEGNVTPYLERSFGGFSRSYTFGDDPLTYSSSGFIWDHVLAAGRSFRNYGEFSYTDFTVPAGKPKTWSTVFEDWKTKTREVRFSHNIGVENLRRYSNPDAPGWNMSIPDQVRADVFLADLAKFEQSGEMPNLCIVYLPQDHTSGVTAGEPTPRACVADGDLALGRIVEALSKSRFWPKLVLFAIEDDPQDGWDHVDGHRSTCIVAGPFVRRGAVVSDFYNQTSVIHTIERILGCPAENQLYALAPLMTTCFADTPDLTPYAALPNQVPLDELNPKKQAAAPHLQRLYAATAALDLTKPDVAEEDAFNRVLWHSVRGDEPYPAEWAGAHGKGLATVGLRLDASGAVEEDD